MTAASSNRQQRRLFERQLTKLIKIKGDNCSLCGAEFQHNGRTFGGYDQDGEIALVGECCGEHLHKVYTVGVFSHRNYDFLPAGQEVHGRGLGNDEIAHALGALGRAIAAADEEMPDDLWRRGGMSLPLNASINVLDSPWRQDDRDWFQQHPQRSHRARFPFAGEVTPEQLAAPDGHRLLLLLRQVEPGKRIKSGFFISDELLPVPEVEAVAHALFDIATRREPVPPNGKALCALIEKYQELPEVM
jgi:hypothetical protein